MALFEVLLRQEYFGREVLNRWHYNATGTPAAVSRSFGLAAAFGGIPDGLTGEFPEDTIMAGIAGFASTSLIFRELVVTSLYDVSDFYSIPYPSTQAGIQGGTPMSAFNAYAFRSNRVRTDIRRGAKRFCGVSEQYAGDNGEVDSSLLTLMNAFAALMGATLTYDDEGNTLSYQPAILSLEKHAPDEDHAKDWYSLYPTDAEQLDHAALGISWAFVPTVTTQNTRKR